LLTTSPQLPVKNDVVVIPKWRLRFGGSRSYIASTKLGNAAASASW